MGRIAEVILIEGIHPQQGQGSLTSRRVVNNEQLRDRAYGLLSLSEKTRESNHLQM